MVNAGSVQRMFKGAAGSKDRKLATLRPVISLRRRPM